MTDIKRDVACLYTPKQMEGHAFVLNSPTRSVIAISQAEVARIAKAAAEDAIRSSSALSLTTKVYVRETAEKMANDIINAMTALWAEQENSDNGLH